MTSVSWIEATMRSGIVTLEETREGRNAISGVHQPLAIVSIFGNPRDGKSFLMNCLDESQVFRILAGQATACTKGVHVPNRIHVLRDYAGRAIGRNDIRLVFVDVEGRGDNAAPDYDLKLYCPILLVSQVVIFNWKGGLAPRAILEELEVLVTVSRQFANHQLGVLYFVLRDAESTVAEVEGRLFTNDNNANFNRARDVIRNAFTEIRVFCLVQPTNDDTVRASTSFNISQCCPEFIRGVRHLREHIVRDCSTPRIIQGIPLTGVLAVETVTDVIASVNSNNVNVFPGGRAQAIVELIITGVLDSASSVFNNLLAVRTESFSDPVTTNAELVRFFSDMRRDVESRLLEYPESLVTPRLHEFSQTQEARITAAVTNMSNRIEELLRDINHRVHRAGSSWSDETHARIPSLTQADFNSRCQTFCTSQVDFFLMLCEENSLDSSWRVVEVATLEFRQQINSLTQRMALAYADHYRATSWTQRVASSLFSISETAALVVEFLGYNLMNINHVNDTTHEVLRSRDIAGSLWDIPFPVGQTEDHSFVALKRDVHELKREYDLPDSGATRKGKKLIQKGIEALDDVNLLSSICRFGIGEVSTRTVLCKIYNAVNRHVDKKNILACLCDELYHSHTHFVGYILCTCQVNNTDPRHCTAESHDLYIHSEVKFHGCEGGVASRLFNALRGFCSLPGLPINPSLREGFMLAFSHRVFREETLNDQLAEAETVLDEYGILTFAEREHWLAAVRQNFADTISA